MTAFPGASVGSIEFTNAHFADADLLPSSHHRVFERMVFQIHQMKRDGDNFTIPDVHEGFAWRRAHAIFERLRSRKRRAAMAERTSDWERVNTEPPVWRHRGRGSYG